MFREAIALIDPIPKEYGNNLIRLNDEVDWSLTCLGLALLKSRIPDYNGIAGRCDLYETRSTLRNCIMHFKADKQAAEEEHPDCPAFFYYTYRSDEDVNVLEELNDPSFKTNIKIETLIRQKSESKCHVIYNDTKPCAAIFIDNRDIRIYHLLISFLSLYFPTLFAEKPMEKKDYDVVVTLNKKEQEPFIQAIKEALIPYVGDFKKTQMKALIKAMHNSKINAVFKALTKQREYSTSLMNQYREAQREVRRLSIEYEGSLVVETMDEPEEELVDFISSNEQVRTLTMNGNEIRFTVPTRLNNFNWEEFESSRRRDEISPADGIFNGKYEHAGWGTNNLLPVFMERENRKKFLSYIFREDSDISVKIVSNYILDLVANTATVNKNFNYIEADPMYKDYIPNPHHKIFACLGGYEGRIPDLLAKRNYVAAVQLCIASASSIDIAENEQTFRPFLSWLMTSKNKVLIRNDGENMTPEEALIWIIDKEKNEAKQNEVEVKVDLETTETNNEEKTE